MLMVVANRTQARFLSVHEGARVIDEIRRVTNEEGRAQNRDIVTDRPGARSSAGDASSGMDSMAPAVDPTEQQMVEFAADVAGIVNEARRKDAVDSLFLIAEPQFLGALRKKLDKPCQKIIQHTLDKDVVDADEETLRGYLKAA